MNTGQDASTATEPRDDRHSKRHDPEREARLDALCGSEPLFDE